MSDRLIPYLRKSSKEDPRISKERQLRSIKAWADQHDVVLLPEVWEPGVSGKKHWRERGLGEAIADCERGQAEGIIVEEQSRLTRANLLQTAEVWEALNGFRLVCTAEGLDTASGDQELSFAIRAALAREQWKQYARRMEDSKRNAVARGIHISARAPFGYVRDPKTKKLVAHPEHGPVVRELFERRAAGESYGTLIRWLDEVAPRTKTGWSKQTIRRILVRRVYLGEASQGKHVLRGAHPALVDEELFVVVQALWRRAEPSPSGPESALLAGLVRCSTCGYALSRSWMGGRWCYRHKHGGTCPAPSSIVMRQLDEHVTEEFFERVKGPGGLAPSASDEARSALRVQLDAARAKRTPFEDPEYVQLLGLDAAKRALAKADGEIAALEAELAALTVETHLPDFVADREAWDDPEMTVEAKHRVLASFVQDVLISRAPRGTRPIARVKIIWHGEVSPIVRPSRGWAGHNGVVDPGVEAA